MRDNKGKFTKGNKFSKGREPVGKCVKTVRRKLLAELAKVAETLYLDRDLALKQLNDGTNSVLHAILAKAIKNNDWKVINSFLERLLGKPSQTVELSTPDLPESPFKAMEDPRESGE